MKNSIFPKTMRISRFNIIHKKIILQQFGQFLASRINTKKKSIPYYGNWVKQAYRYTSSKNYHAPLNARQKQDFLHYLSRHYEDWQVKPALFTTSSIFEKRSLKRNFLNNISNPGKTSWKKPGIHFD